MIKKLKLVSNNLGYDLCPDPEDEIEQRLTINNKGQVSLSRFCYGVNGTKYPLIDKVSFSIPSTDTAYIMKVVTEFFESDYEIDYVTDVGEWSLTLLNDEGVENKVSGPLCRDLFVKDGGLSDIIRSKLRRNDLLAFDGNPSDQ